MNKMTQNHATDHYESPRCNTFTIMPEGVLCSSENLTIPDWTENEDIL